MWAALLAAVELRAAMGGDNAHIYAFMQRKAPIPCGHDAHLPKKMVIKEEDTMINYPKDPRGTILLCAPRSRRAHAPAAP